MADKTKDGSTPSLKTSGKPNPADIGRSPQEKRGNVNSYVDFQPVPDPEDGNGGEAAQGGLGYLKSNARYNTPYEDGGGIYSRPLRKR